MEPINLFKNNFMTKYSPNGLYISSINDKSLIIRESTSCRIIKQRELKENVSYYEWSFDSTLILIVLNKIKNCTIIYSVNDDFKCEINEGNSGLLCSRFLPDCRHIFTLSKNNLKLNLWSLLNDECHFIPNPKDLFDCVDYSSNNRLIAIATRSQYKDYITLLYCGYWKQLNQFELQSMDCSMIRFSPDMRCIAVADTVLTYSILIYSLIGEKMAVYKAYDNSLGVKCISWCPNSEFLCIGSCDNKIRFLNHYTWSCITEYECSQTINNEQTVY